MASRVLSRNVVSALAGVRGFAAKGKAKQAAKKSKKGAEDQNFELMLRSLRGRYPELYVWTPSNARMCSLRGMVILGKSSRLKRRRTTPRLPAALTRCPRLSTITSCATFRLRLT